MPLPKDIRFISFDCYGTLIDWESVSYTHLTLPTILRV